ncbi:signal transduction histidine kinase [Amylostereum chailletii]|nr:signal transduction histidine kinase [Amylostereum chailletii]
MASTAPASPGPSVPPHSTASPSRPSRAPSVVPETAPAPPVKSHPAPPKSPSPSPPSPTSESPAPPASTAPSDLAASTPAPTPKPTAEEDPSTADIVDFETFSQILELDEDGTYEFSAGMAGAYFSQAQTTFDDMDEAYASSNLDRLRELGHFLKGSSAALGLYKVQASCEKIQNYGKLRDEVARVDLTPSEALDKIEPTLAVVKEEYAIAERWLKKWYEDKGGIPDLDG